MDKGSDWIWNRGETRNQMAIFKKILHKLKLRIFQDHLKTRCSPMKKGRIEFSITYLEPGETQNQMQCQNILLDKFKLRIF